MASPAPTPVAHTPMVFVKAGGAATWSAECVKALADCGLSPDDFGSYNAVVARSRSAQQRIMQDRYARRPGAPPPSPPSPPVDAHDRLLAQSEAGHLAQNAVFQRRRGDACQNVQPSTSNGQQYPGALCYSDQHAPCGPHPGAATRRGTTHWAVSGNEQAISGGGGATPAPVNTPVSAQQISTVAQGSALRTAAGATDADMSAGCNGWDRRRRATEAAERGASAASLGSAATPNAPTAAAATNATASAETNASAALAAECIEAFRRSAEAAMRQQVMNDYGPANYPSTLAGLQQQQASANQAVIDARARIATTQAARQVSPTPQARYEEAQANMALRQAYADRDRANRAVASAPCLAQQVPQLQQQMAANGGQIPPCSGETPHPPGTLPGTPRPAYPTTPAAPAPAAPPPTATAASEEG